MLSFLLIITSVVVPTYAGDPAATLGTNVIISQVYGAGGNTGAVYSNDFVELYNPTDAPVDLTGWSLQQASAKGNFSNIMPLSGTVQPKSYFLIQLAAGANKFKDLPTPDLTGTLGLGGSDAKIALAKDLVAVTGPTATNVVDFVGIGAATTYEGSGAAPAMSSTNSVVRKLEGVDTNDNKADFIQAPVAPRNSTPAVETKCAKPVASHPSGIVNLNTKVTFTTTTTSGAAIQFNEVSATHNAWTTGSSIVITKDTTVYVRAVRADLETSDVATFTYTVDNELKVTIGTDKTDAISGATVLLSANDEKAKIYYTLDGSDATDQSTLYTNGVKLVGNIGDKITLKAFAKADGRADSAVVTRVFTIKDPNDVMTVDQVLNLPTGTANVEVKGTLAYFAQSFDNPVIHSVIDGKTYGLYIFGKAPTGAKIGDEIKLKGNFEIRNGNPQLSGVTTSSIIGKGHTIVPKEVTIEELIAEGSKMLGHVVKIKNVKLGKYSDSSSTPITNAAGKSINIFKAVPYPVQVVEGDVVDVIAMVATHHSTIQLYTGTKQANGYNAYDVANDTKPPLVTLRDTYANAKPGQDYTIAVSAEDNKGVKEVKITYTIGSKTVSDQVMTFVPENNEYRFVIKGNEIPMDADDFKFTVSATDVANNKTTTEARTVLIDAKPQFVKVLPARNGSTGDIKNPLISVSLMNAGSKPEVKVTLKKEDKVLVNNQTMTAGKEADVFEYQTGTLTDGLHKVTVNVKREDGVINTTTWNFTVGTPKYRAFFGQLHGHTAEYSDGSGTLADGLNYLKSIPASEKVDFVSFTDHSHYFDSATAPNAPEAMNDKSKMTPESLAKWEKYLSSMQTFNEDNAGTLLAFSGYEMTWSGGPGHINTFNSNGLVSRNNTALNNKTDDAGLKAYYEELIKNTDPLANLSQFNHPGPTFKTFSDFAYWSPSIDSKMVSVEVGNGEGAIGSGGYFPSYTEYTKALDKGWHVAPTNNQDNHQGRWGNSNTARTVIITNDLSQTGLLTGLKNMSVYATEDHNLNIQYTLNDQMMGSIISEVPTAPLQFNLNIEDPDQSDVIAKVEIITNSGRIAESKTFEGNSVEWNFELPPTKGYYYVRVTQADKNIAVTAPIWIGQAPRVGINSVESSTKMPVTNEALKLTTKVFNNELTAVSLKSVEYSMGETILSTFSEAQELVSEGLFKHEFIYTPQKAGKQNITVKATMIIEGQEAIYTKDIELMVRDAEKLVYVGIDASHYNEYVRGNYKDSMGNFANMAVDYDVRVVELETSEALIAATQNSKYKMIVLTPPTRRNGTGFLLGYKSYTDEEIAALKAFAQAGNTIIVSGWSDAYENYTKFSDQTPHKLPAEEQMSAQQNKLLEALGSSLRISDDEIRDDKNNGGSAQRLYLKNFNLDNPFLKGVNEKVQVYSNYGGASIYAVGSDQLPTGTLPKTVSPMVYGFTESYSSDRDKDGTTNTQGVEVPKYAGLHMVAASEVVTYASGKQGTIIAAGAAFMSNFEIKVELDSYATPEYCNFTILQNIIKFVNPIEITDIAKVHTAKEGEIFTVIGIATSNASGFNKETAFFDSIYIQDATAGINLFPVSGNIRAGQTLQIKGTTSSYNGERQLNVERVTIIDPEVKPLPAPIEVTTAQAAKSAHLGSLIKVSGKITRFEINNDDVESIFVMDDSGVEALVFIDGYINAKQKIQHLEKGANITAVGLSSISTKGARVRVRSRDDVVCKPAPVYPVLPDLPTPVQPSKPAEPVTPVNPTTPAEPKVDVQTGEAGVKVAVTVPSVASEEGKSVATLTKETMDSLKKEAANGKNATLEVVVPSASGETQVSLVVEKENFKALVGEENGALKVSTGLASVEFDQKALTNINSASEGSDVVIAVAKRDVKTLPASVQEIVGEKPVFDFTVTSGDKKVSSFGEGSAKVSMPYTLGRDENPNAIVVYYIDAAGKVQNVRGNYDAKTKTVVFVTNHFSTYAVGYNAVKFSDVKSSVWYYAAVSNMAARNIAKGTSKDAFNPEAVITRGQFMVMLMNAYGIVPKAQADNFADAGNTYYTDYLATAKKLGITKGIGDNKFAPEKSLSKQEMLTLLYNTLTEMKQIEKAAKVQSFESFADQNTVASYAVQAMRHFVENGQVKGFNNKLNPNGLATRAETAQILYNLLLVKGN